MKFINEGISFKSIYRDEDFASLGKTKSVYKSNNSMIIELKEGSIKIDLISKRTLRIKVTYKKIKQTIPITDLQTQKLTVKDSKIIIDDSKERYEIPLPSIGEPLNFTIFHKDKEVLFPFSFQSSGTGITEFNEEFSVNNQGYIRFSFSIPTEYGIYGVGETFNNFNKWGTKIITFPTDNLHLRAKNVYKGIPFFWSNAGIGLLVNTYYPVKMDFGSTIGGLITITVPISEVEFILFLKKPKEILKEFFNIAGKPEMPPEWSFGLWVSRWAGIGWKNMNEVRELVENFEKYNIPFDVLAMDSQ